MLDLVSRLAGVLGVRGDGGLEDGCRLVPAAPLRLTLLTEKTRELGSYPV
ncbi:hypothetical protein [Streptomyces aureocirculatus]|nr:hypothetical protein [Streptomyces aureocirculatus]